MGKKKKGDPHIMALLGEKERNVRGRLIVCSARSSVRAGMASQVVFGSPGLTQPQGTSAFIAECIFVFYASQCFIPCHPPLAKEHLSLILRFVYPLPHDKPPESSVPNIIAYYFSLSCGLVELTSAIPLLSVVQIMVTYALVQSS